MLIFYGMLCSCCHRCRSALRWLVAEGGRDDQQRAQSGRFRCDECEHVFDLMEDAVMTVDPRTVLLSLLGIHRKQDGGHRGSH